jgi:hypothetical protein
MLTEALTYFVPINKIRTKARPLAALSGSEYSNKNSLFSGGFNLSAEEEVAMRTLCGLKCCRPCKRGRIFQGEVIGEAL